MQDSPDFLLNTDDLDEASELLDKFIFGKCRDLFFHGVTDDYQHKESSRRVKKELWDFFKQDYFKGCEK
jgi:hypothetical protein